MTVKLAIHSRPGSFSDRWIQYCSEHGIDYRIVDCFDSDILEQLKGVDGLLWHWFHSDPKAQLAARQIIVSAERSGVKVFPDIATCWHYDDKIGQKYLLESIEAPLVPTHVFFDEEEAMKWIDRAEFPKVFKLRCGASSENVRLVRTKKEAEKLCKKAFDKGFPSVSGYFSDAVTKMRKTGSVGQLINKVIRMPKILYAARRARNFIPAQRGYIYFQDFLPDNDFDTRITIIGNRAFGFTRNTRPNDFRASGSGDLEYDLKRIDMRCIKIAFETAGKLKTQSLAFDFIFDQKNNPRIVEISYCYQSKAVYNCSGFWDREMNWHVGHVWPEDAILIDLLEAITV
ncbi:COGs COG0439 [hydrothermal vent metagenome]|uniref:COGs COG0439 n=1 Tax=hydrothermal vent metagenome TaxID=652676 RepID=A0A3B1DBI3_9ZZZZ